MKTTARGPITQTMAISHPRVLARSIPPVAAIDALVAAACLLLIGALTLLTPAFTDYEVEIEPGLLALLSGHVQEGMRLLPIYGGSILGVLPGGWIAKSLGGGDLAIYRGVVVPGAIGVAGFAALAGHWLRTAGAERRVQLTVVAALGLSPCVALAWGHGHPEEPLVAAAALAGLLLVARGGARSTIAGGVLMGLAAAGKPWAVLLLPLALATTRSGRDAARLVISSAVAGAALVAPIALTKLDAFTATITSTGGSISSVGNLWWFFGRPNPEYVKPGSSGADGVVQLFTSRNSARISPDFIAAHSHELIVVLATVLAGIWWWRIGRAPLEESAPRSRQERIASILLIAAAILWWRAVADPWFQAYYLTPAFIAIVLADARLGRVPITGLIVWGAVWLLHGQNAPDMGLTDDATSALRLAWLVPMGVWITTRALRPIR